MIVKVIGQIVEIKDRKSGVTKKGNSWVSQEFILEESNPNSNYPTRIAFTVFGEEDINFFNFQMNQNVAVDCVLSSTMYNDRYFTSLRALSPNRNVQTQQQQQTAPQPQERPQQTRQQTSNVGADDLPF